MSILIKGVSFEDFKPFCPCLNGDYGWCDIPGIERCYGMGKDGCPLVPVPPHGRLIDADALDYFKDDSGIAAFDFVTRGQIHAAPIIIPAEEGE